MNSDIFIEKYTRFVADLGRIFLSKNKSHVWWAVWLSSKNRFCSKLNELAQILFRDKTVPELSSRFVFFASIVKNVAATAKFAMKYYVQSVVARIRFSKGYGGLRRRLSGQSVYVIKTFSYAHSFSKKNFSDVFFGQLPNYLESKCHRNIIVLHDTIGAFRKSISFEGNKENLFPLQFFLTEKTFLRIALCLVKGLFARFEKVFFLKEECTRHVQRQYWLDLISANTFHSFLVFYASRKIAHDFCVTHFLLTYENNPWERMAILAIKKHRPSATVIGYVHTVIPQASVNMFFAPGELEFTPHPDRVLTIGSEQTRILKKYSDFSGVDLEEACGLRFDYLKELKPVDRKLGRRLLVVLEGVPQAAQMLNYALLQMKDKADWNIVVRTHPALSIKEMDDALDVDYKRLPHVELSSQGALIDDLNSAGVVLYWGSTAALEALQVGVPVVHYDIGSVLSYDPLFTCSTLKWTVKPSENLHRLLESILAIPHEVLNSMRAEARAFVSNYIFSVTDERLALFDVVKTRGMG